MLTGVGDGRLVVLHCDMRPQQPQWTETCIPQPVSGVVLCMHVLNTCFASSHAPRLIAVGCSSGAVVLWWCTNPHATIPDFIPVWHHASLHPSAVTSVCVAACEDAAYSTLITGGDDQSLSIVVLDTAQLQPTWIHRVPNAHASAVRGVWTDGRYVLSVGLDQMLRVWRVDANEGVCMTTWQWVQVLEPEGLHVVQDQGMLHVMVCGRGMEYLMIQRDPAVV